MAINTYLSIITLNVNGLNIPIKRHRVADWIKKQKSSICCLQETHLRAKDTYRLNVRGWEKIFYASGQDRKTGVALLISDKTDFKTKAIKKDKEGHYLMVKGSIQEEDITIINIYTPNIGAPRYIQQILTDTKGEIDGNTVIVGDFSKNAGGDVEKRVPSFTIGGNINGIIPRENSIAIPQKSKYRTNI
uniref:exodeoxyribonuclease III n=1 Tax=Sus scrofa TaxID=9823 RepID=A0A8D0PMB7_PIG